MFKTIVVGVDGREGGRDALSLAGRLALIAGGEVIAVRALDFDYYASRAGSRTYASVAEQGAQRALAEELERAGLTAGTQVVGDRSPARALHRVGERTHADVIVVGSTHHGRLGRVFVGDDAAATLHASPCPVAVAPRGLASRQWETTTRIGVGVDGRPEARQAFALAVALARDCGASIRAVTAVAAPPLPPPEYPGYDADWLRRAKEGATAEMRELVADLDVEASGDVVVGNPVQELVRLSGEVDLLVLGSRAWGPVRRIVIGSASAHLMHRSRCPLLVLPRGAATGKLSDRHPAIAEREGQPTA